jgi:beta-glucosidase
MRFLQRDGHATIAPHRCHVVSVGSNLAERHGEEYRLITFPKDFLWGTTTSAYQVEGGNFSADWWRWEQRPGRIADRRTSSRASEHFEHYESDFELARKLGHNAHLFSLEWSRVQPKPDHFDPDALVHYANVAEALARRGFVPICALNHVTLPSWFAEQGGWLSRDAPQVFAEFTQRVVEALAAHCSRWIPLLEPEHLVTMAWLEGLWPPGKRGVWSVFTALSSLMRAHAESYAAIHRLQPEAEVGVSIRARNCVPLNDQNAWDLRAARREMRRANELLLSATCRGETPFPFGGARRSGGTADFIAVSYYGKEYVRFHAAKPTRLFRSLTNAQGATIRPSVYDTAPEGLWDVLKSLATYDKPLLIAGNGLSTLDDSVRCNYLVEHLKIVQEAIAQGIDVRGYFHRSLLDGFEWTDGYSARYGLVHVDRETLARTPNPSAYLYKDICESGAIRPGVVGKFAPAAAARIP